MYKLCTSFYWEIHSFNKPLFWLIFWLKTVFGYHHHPVLGRIVILISNNHLSSFACWTENLAKAKLWFSPATSKLITMKVNRCSKFIITLFILLNIGRYSLCAVRKYFHIFVWQSAYRKYCNHLENTKKFSFFLLFAKINGHFPKNF